VKIDFDWTERAVEAIKSGLTNRVDSQDKKITVYKCGTIIRIDIKEV